jgi:hypothetical protein
MNPPLRLCLAWIALLAASGCMHRPTPFLPDDWRPHEASLESLADDPAQARLHVLLMYAPLACSHSALRLHRPGRGVIFWDPGGGYGSEGFVEARRWSDLIVTNTPTVAQYLDWREKVPTARTEIFEFDVTDAEADSLWEVLRHGTDRTHPAGRFNTTTTGGACGMALSDFLARFADEVVHVDPVFFPHDLAQQLYQQDPDRVLIWEDGVLREFRPPGRDTDE